MSTQNKLKVKSPGADVDFMFSGCSIRLWYTDPQTAGPFPEGLVDYRIVGNRRSLRISRLKDKVWENIISEDFTMDPLNITEEEKFMVGMLSDLSPFEREMYAMAGNIIRMWHNDAAEDYAKKYLIQFMKEHLEQIV